MEMQETHKNMRDIRNKLGVNSIRWKIEKRTLQRIGHVMRWSEERPVKAAIFGWYEDLEDWRKNHGKMRETTSYWMKIIKEAGVDWKEIDYLTANRKEWKLKIKERMKRLAEWEHQQGHQSNDVERIERNLTPEATNNTCPECGKVCKNQRGLRIHIKRMHKDPTIIFKCAKCSAEFKTENTKTNHEKRCDEGGIVRAGYKKLSRCNREITGSNYARHRRCCQPHEEDEEPPTATRPPSRTLICPHCGGPKSAANLVRHIRFCPLRTQREGMEQ